jgi:hypothetical protein
MSPGKRATQTNRRTAEMVVPHVTKGSSGCHLTFSRHRTAEGRPPSADRDRAVSGHEGAAVPGCDRVSVASSFHGQMELPGTDSGWKLGEDQHVPHHEQLVSVEGPRLLGGGMQEQNAAADSLPLTADKQRPALVHYMRDGLRRGSHQHGGESTAGRPRARQRADDPYLTTATRASMLTTHVKQWV